MPDLTAAVSKNDHIQGNVNAPVVLVEYGDYQCSYCGQAYPVIKQLQDRFADKLCLVFRNFPLADIHPEALNAAVFAEYAAQHDVFWQAHDALYENQQSLSPQFYLELAPALGLSEDGFRQAFEDASIRERLQRDIESGNASGVNGTPAFFINGEKYDVRGGFEDLLNPIAAIINK